MDEMDADALRRQLARMMATMAIQAKLTTLVAKLVLSLVNARDFDVDTKALGLDLKQVTYDMEMALATLQRLNETEN